jgi:3-hydroxyacyl-CoA dehydrogenase/enoyl-CoA hydratase/3-hydroxybutyryl-CoA epimerase
MEGILLATIDMPGRPMNVFSTDLMNSLERLLDEVATRPEIRGVVIASGKQAFLAGADLEMVQGYTERAKRASDDELHTTCGRLGRLFRRLETTGKPFVAAIDGLALGGGLELALACHERVATESAGTRLGLPEVKLGLLPGAGGTQRLPRLIGVSAAFQLLLKGEPVSAQRALELGIIGAIVPPSALLASAQERARELARQPSRAPWDREQWRAPENPFDFSAADAPKAIAQHVGLSDDEFTHYPAYRTIMDCVIGGWTKPLQDACRWEMDCFVRLIRDKVAGNMVRTLFLNRQRATKLVPRGTTAEALRVAIEGPGEAAARALLSGAHITIVERERLPKAGLVLITSPGSHVSGNATEVAWLRATPCPLTAFRLRTGVWVSDLTVHGRIVEVCVQGDEPAEAALEIARGLQATALITQGESLLQRLETAQAASLRLTGPEDRLLAIALAAAQAWTAGSVRDTGLADTAAVIAGFHPAYTGGPFTYLQQRVASDVRGQATRAQAQYGELFAIPDGFDKLWVATSAASA